MQLWSPQGWLEEKGHQPAVRAPPNAVQGSYLFFLQGPIAGSFSTCPPGPLYPPLQRCFLQVVSPQHVPVARGYFLPRWRNLHLLLMTCARFFLIAYPIVFNTTLGSCPEDNLCCGTVVVISGPLYCKHAIKATPLGWSRSLKSQMLHSAFTA